MKIRVMRTKSLVSRVKGLIGASEIKPLVIETRFGIHTFGMKKPIDVLVLDSTGKIVTLKENIAPWRIFVWNPAYKTVVELPLGFIKEKDLSKGLQIELIE